jgi:hypothetical protein
MMPRILLDCCLLELMLILSPLLRLVMMLMQRILVGYDDSEISQVMSEE